MPSKNRICYIVIQLLILSLLIYGVQQPAIAGNTDLDAGLQYMNDGQCEAALKCLDRAVDADPTLGDVHYWRAKCLAALGRSKDASAEFRVALLLCTDEKMKDDCRAQLKESKANLPQGSVNDTDKVFKLTSKKLDWNLELSDDTRNLLKEENLKLAGMKITAPNIAYAQQIRRRSRILSPQLAAEIHNGPPHSTNLSQEDCRDIARSDVMIILDHSGSMGTPDCPSSDNVGQQARISWCIEELNLFSKNIRAMLPHGLTFITYDTRPTVYKISSSSELNSILNTLSFGGGTRLAPALEEAFQNHMAHANQPLLIAIVSDALIDVASVQTTIADATRRLPLPNGVFITLLQVGVIAEHETATTLNLLDNLRSTAGASYDCFIGIPFSRLRREGFGKDIVIAMHTNTGHK